MDDDQVWQFEDSLWRADEAHYRESIAPDCLMVVPAPPYVMTGEEAVQAVAKTPRWTTADFDRQRISRPPGGVIVIAYRMRASRPDADPYEAHCTSTYREADGKWQVVQHQQTPVVVAPA